MTTTKRKTTKYSRFLPEERLPNWITPSIGNASQLEKVKKIVKENRLHRICEEGRCPNRGECYAAGTATFLLGGSICTRSCAFCQVEKGKLPEIVNLFENVSATLVTDTEANLDNYQIVENNTQEGNYCKTYTYIINPGDVDGGDSTETSTDAHLVDPKAVMRYQLLHAQLVNILVPHNAELTVCEVIRLNIENITQDDKIIKEFNQHRSGYYLILHLCHSFSTSNSFTSLTLVRDEYGYASKLGGVQ